MKLKIKYFGRIVELTGIQTEEIELDNELTVLELDQLIKSKFPKLEEEAYQIAVNQIIVAPYFQILADAEIAFLPPFAGG